MHAAPPLVAEFPDSTHEFKTPPKAPPPLRAELLENVQLFRVRLLALEIAPPRPAPPVPAGTVGKVCGPPRPATALPTDKTYANKKKAAEILNKVFATDQNHPGIAHYLIVDPGRPRVIHHARSGGDIRTRILIPSGRGTPGGTRPVNSGGYFIFTALPR